MASPSRACPPRRRPLPTPLIQNNPMTGLLTDLDTARAAVAALASSR